MGRTYNYYQFFDTVFVPLCYLIQHHFNNICIVSLTNIAKLPRPERLPC